MKKLKAFLTASVMTITALCASAWNTPGLAAADQVSIMPIGDSITFGYGEDGGYRKYLDQALKARDIDFDMVGPEGNNNSTNAGYNGQMIQYDGNHAGYSGFTIKQQYPIPSWGENGLLERLQSKDAVRNAQPDIVLLIIGTNDMTANRDLSACEQDLHTLVDYILGDLPEGGVVFMGSIPEFTAYGGNPTRVANYNATVQKVAESYGDNVQFADVHGCLNGMADMQDDKLHPSGQGYEKMGKFWAEVIEEYLDGQGSTVDPDDPLILHSDFENGLSGWKARGGAAVAATTDEAAEGTGSASVTGRTAEWNGIAYSLSSKRCPAGSIISVQASVMQKTDSTVHFKMSMQYDNDGTAVYDTFAEQDAAPGEWVTLSCPVYTMLDGTSPVLYIETDTDLCDFYLDEVIVMKSDGIVPTEPETDPVTEPVTEPADQMGDVTNDGRFELTDVVLFQKWLLGIPDTKLANWEAADFNKDSTLDVFDLALMKRELLNKKAVNYVEPTERPFIENPFMVMKDGLALRLGPDESYEAVASIPKNTIIRELGYQKENNDWMFTNYNGQNGWIKIVDENGEQSVIAQLYADKPVIYLYPEEETDVHVELDLTGMDLSTTYPKYNDGWDVTAYPDGTLLNKADGTHHRYLFWDASNCRVRYDFSKGFCVAGSDTEAFLKEKLTYLGLTEAEMNEFIVYWLPRMEHNAYNLIAFQGDAYTDAAALHITPSPDSICRIFMTYVPMESAVEIEPQELETFERKGFAVVEWGGSEIR